MTHCGRTQVALLLAAGSLLLTAIPVRASQENPPSTTASDSPSTADAAQQRFAVMEYRVMGNTVLADRDIEKVLYPLLGKDKTLADVEVARKALEDSYHEHGYGTAFVDIPPQTVQEGLVRLRVTEGRLERTVINGAKYFPERDVMARLPAATPGSVLQLSKLQEQLGAINAETADRAVVPILKAGTEPGTVDLALKVNDTLPLHGSAELNNQATVNTDSLRSILSLSYDDLFGRLDSLALQYQFTPQRPDQVRVIAANYSMHAFESGLQPSLSYINSNSNVPTAGTLGVLGIGEITSAKLNYPLLVSPGSVQSANLGIDYKHFRNTINQDATTALDTPITYLNISAGYNGLWRGDVVMTTFNTTLNLGPRHLVNNAGAFENDRYKGRANYFYLRSDLTTTIKLPASFVLRLRAAGQFAAEPLIANEDYPLTGADGVRGYLEAEELVDRGIKGTFQLTSPQWRRHEWVIGDIYTFFDAGKGSVIDALPGQTAITTVRSWGMGFDLFPGQKYTGSASWARVLDTASETRDGDSRVLFTVRGSF
jgi:hemolysin activation/secretion protein